MKPLMTLLLILICTNFSFAQEKLKGIMPMKNGTVCYSDSISINNTSKEVLYKRAKQWMIGHAKVGNEGVFWNDDDSTFSYLSSRNFEFKMGSPTVMYQLNATLEDNLIKVDLTYIRLKFLMTYSTPGSLAPSTHDEAYYTIEIWSERNSRNENKKYLPMIQDELLRRKEEFKLAMKNPPASGW